MRKGGWGKYFASNTDSKKVSAAKRILHTLLLQIYIKFVTEKKITGTKLVTPLTPPTPLLPPFNTPLEGQLYMDWLDHWY